MTFWNDWLICLISLGCLLGVIGGLYLGFLVRNGRRRVS